jgi:hypothetical protein
MCLPLVRASERPEICQAWWHILVTLDTLELQIGRLRFKTSRRKKVSKALSKKPSWVWWVTPIIPATKEIEVGGLWCPWQKHKTLPGKQIQEKSGGMAQVVEYMSNKLKVFKPQYRIPHQKKSKDKFVTNTDVFSILTIAYGWCSDSRVIVLL